MIKSTGHYNLHPLMNHKIRGPKIVDYRNRTRKDEKYIPQIFNKKIVFQSFHSFQQNNRWIGKKLRSYVLNNIYIQNILMQLEGKVIYMEIPTGLYSIQTQPIFTRMLSIINIRIAK